MKATTSTSTGPTSPVEAVGDASTSTNLSSAGGGNSLPCETFPIATSSNNPPQPVNDYTFKLVSENNGHKLKSVIKSQNYEINPAPLSVDEFIIVVKEKFLPDFLEKSKGKKVTMFVTPISEKLDIVPGGEAKKILSSEYVMRTNAIPCSGKDTLEEIISQLNVRKETIIHEGSGWSVLSVPTFEVQQIVYSKDIKYYGTHIEWPKGLSGSKQVINIKTREHCVEYSIRAHFMKKTKHHIYI